MRVVTRCERLTHSLWIVEDAIRAGGREKERRVKMLNDG